MVRIGSGGLGCGIKGVFLTRAPADQSSWRFSFLVLMRHWVLVSFGQEGDGRVDVVWAVSGSAWAWLTGAEGD